MSARQDGEEEGGGGFEGAKQRLTALEMLVWSKYLTQ